MSSCAKEFRFTVPNDRRVKTLSGCGGLRAYIMPMNPGFTALEQAVLAAMCEMHAADRSALEIQLGMAVVSNRENTGSGFYTHFEIQRDASPAIGGERMRAGPMAKIEGLQHGMGFILWLKDGRAATLEGYSFGENTSAVSLDTTQFELRALQSNPRFKKRLP